MRYVINSHLKEYSSNLKEGSKLSLTSVKTYLMTKGVDISLKAVKRRCAILRIDFKG